MYSQHKRLELDVVARHMPEQQAVVVNCEDSLAMREEQNKVAEPHTEANRDHDAVGDGEPIEQRRVACESGFDVMRASYLCALFCSGRAALVTYSP